MIQMKLYLASLFEYVMIWGIPICSEGHSGRHRVAFWDTVIDGEAWYFAEGQFEKRVYRPGDYEGARPSPAHRAQGPETVIMASTVPSDYTSPWYVGVSTIPGQAGQGAKAALQISNPTCRPELRSIMESTERVSAKSSVTVTTCTPKLRAYAVRTADDDSPWTMPSLKCRFIRLNTAFYYRKGRDSFYENGV